MWFKASAAMVNVSEGMTLTLANFQLKLFTSIAAVAAVIGTSFIAATPAEARNGWFYVGETKRGASMYSKSLGCRGSICTVVTQYSDGKGKQFWDKFNCSNWTVTYENGQGRTSPIFPTSHAEFIARKVCG